MKISVNEIRIGSVIEYNGKLWVIVKIQHVKPGKGGAFAQMELKSLKDGQKLNERFRTEDKLEKVYLEELDFQYLYRDDNDLYLMNQTTFEQIQLPADLVGDSVAFLEEGMIVKVCLYENTPISVTLPQSVILEIVEAEPVVKGQTATSSYKPATLSNGVKIMVPQHIEAGTKVVVNTSDGSYVEKAK